jgi:hypothetical protein
VPLVLPVAAFCIVDATPGAPTPLVPEPPVPPVWLTMTLTAPLVEVPLPEAVADPAAPPAAPEPPSPPIASTLTVTVFAPVADATALAVADPALPPSPPGSPDPPPPPSARAVALAAPLVGEVGAFDVALPPEAPPAPGTVPLPPAPPYARVSLVFWLLVAEESASALPPLVGEGPLVPGVPSTVWANIWVQFRVETMMVRKIAHFPLKARFRSEAKFIFSDTLFSSSAWRCAFEPVAGSGRPRTNWRLFFGPMATYCQVLVMPTNI